MVTDEQLPVGDEAESGARLAGIFQVIQSPLAVLSPDLAYIDVNAAYAAVSGRSREELLGQRLFDVFPENPETRDDESPTSLRRSLQRVLETRVPDSMPLIRYDLLTGDEYQERFWHVTSAPVLDDDGQVLWIVINPEEVTAFIDERLRLEARGSAGSPASQMNAVDDIFTAAVARLQSLSDLASALVGASSPEEVAEAVLSDGLEMVGAVAGSLVIVNADRLDIVGSVDLSADLTDQWRSHLIEPGRDPFSDAVTSGDPLYFADRSAFVDRYPHHADAIRDSSHQAWAVLPLRGDDEITGAIGVIFGSPTEFGTPVRLVLSTLANLTSQAASRARLLVEQTVALESIEAAFESRVDEIAGIRTSHLYRASTAAGDAGGDWYDLIDLDNGTVLMTIGDVANHGAVAVGEMVRARSTVHALAHLGLGPEEIANEASAVLSKMASTFTTCILGLLDHSTMEFRWTNAGHPHPLVVAADGTVESLEQTNGPPIGSGFLHAYGFERRRLRPGETLVLYTDGLIERPDVSADESLAGLRRALTSLDPTSPDLAQHLFDDLHPPDRQRDDVAILTLHIEGHHIDSHHIDGAGGDGHR